MMKNLIDALPETFDFYHLGQVEKVPQPKANEALRPDLADLDGMQAVAFSLKGDSRGWIVILFDAGLDESTYIEMGNVIASRTATRIAEREGADVWISPPQKLDARQIKALTLSGNAFEHRTYVHASPQGIHAIETLVFAAPPSGELYA